MDMEMQSRTAEPMKMHEEKQVKPKQKFSKTAKGVMRMMLGMSALVASVAGLITATGYMTWVRRSYPHGV